MGCYKRKNHKKKSINVHTDKYYSKNLIDEISFTLDEMREDIIFDNPFNEYEPLEVNSMFDLSIDSNEKKNNYIFNLNGDIAGSNKSISDQEYEYVSKKVDVLLGLITEKDDNCITYENAYQMAHRALEKIL